MAGLWRNNPDTKGGKYLVLRRDGTVPQWPFFVLGARDPAAPAALMAYAAECERLNMDPQYVADVRELAADFQEFYGFHGAGDPDAPRHRTDDPATVAKMLTSPGA